jgi:hypothetical protein
MEVVMGFSEILFCVSILIPIVPMLIFKQFRLASVFGAFYICFGLMEWASVVQTGRSISQLFWEFDKVNPVGGWLIVGAMAIMWTSLLIHFKKRKK